MNHVGDVDESGRIYSAVSQDFVRRMRNWVRGKDGTPLGGSGSFVLAGTSNVFESRVPTLYGEAADTETALRTLPGRYQQAVRQFWIYEGRSLRWHSRHRQVTNAHSDPDYPVCKYDTFERWVMKGHELLVVAIGKQDAAQQARRQSTERAVQAARPAEPAEGALCIVLTRIRRRRRRVAPVA